MDTDPDRLNPTLPSEASDDDAPAPDSTPEAAGHSTGDYLGQLALRLVSPPVVVPRLGLRFAPTPDLPDEETVEWRRRWTGDDAEDRGGPR